MYRYIYILLLFLPCMLFGQNAQIMGGANIKLQGTAKAKLYGNLELNSSTFTQDGSNTFSLNGDWLNSGEYNANSGKVVFFGDASQTITNNSNNNFYDFEINKTDENVYLSNSSTITILNDLIFTSSSLGNLYTRNNGLVYVGNDVVRNTVGFVDGHLALNFVTNDNNNRTFTIGRDADYTPVELFFNSTNTFGGYVHAISNPRTLNMLGSQLQTATNVEREYTLGLPVGSTFGLGTSGSFTLNIHYLNPDDIRNGANSNTFETARYDGPIWAQTLMGTGVRTATSVQSFNTKLGTFVVGPEDFYLELFSRSSGSWSEPSNWSLYGYGSQYASSFAPRSRDNAFVGDGDVIDFDNDITILPDRTLTVEQAGPSGEQGQLNTDTYVLSGGGTFTLNSGGILSIGDVDGITEAPTNAGNIRVAQRNYNPGTHNNGNFIYTSNLDGVTGDALPDDMNDITINSNAIITLQKNINVNNDLTITSGTFNLDDKIATGTNSGTFVIEDDARIAIGDMNNSQIAIPGFSTYSIAMNSTFEFDGSTQTISLLPLNFNTSLGFGNVVVNNIGTKTIASNLNIRGDLSIIGSAYLNNQAGVDNLRVYGNIFNLSSGLQNDGFIYIGP